MVKLDQIQESIKPELARLNAIIAETLKSPSALTDHIVTDYLKTKGKQIRPVLVLLSAKLFGGINEQVLNAGAAIELLHNASLIHDDVIDQSMSRRGLPTVNSVWNNHVAVLVGDFFVSGALACAVRAGDMRVLNSLSRMGADLAMGEIDQIDNARNREITEEVYMTIISRKTASLFTSCVEVGGITAGADDDALAKMKRFAELLGQCFQIKDDTFDYFQDPIVGKPTGNDLREGKITLPLIYALGRKELPDSDEMNKLAHKPELNDEEINRLVEYAKAGGGIDYAYRVMERLRQEADALLDEFPASDTVDAFKSIFSYIITRNK
ncbi:MAG: polyprenyl synthetase family protein [Bacteroidales bacterium]|nr:polyprenyl synthetase family protein [Bacteroidales bacterium]